MTARIGIVMPAFNAEAFLERAIAAVQAQTVSSWRLVIVDDCSEDRTLALARRLAAQDERISVVERESNGGPARACNSGYAALDDDADLVTFLDADDVWEPTALESLLAALDRNPAAVGAHGLRRFVDEREQATGRCDALDHRRRYQGRRFGRASKEEPTTFDMLAYAPVFGTGGTMLVRREVLDRVGGFRARFQPAEDWDLWVRLSRRGHFAAVDDVVLNYRLHPSQLIRTPRMVTATERVQREIVESSENTPAQRRMARRAARRRERGMAWTRVRWALAKALHLRMLDAAKELRRAAFCLASIPARQRV